LVRHLPRTNPMADRSSNFSANSSIATLRGTPGRNDWDWKPYAAQQLPKCSFPL
jgi:hypothetical protein